MSRVIVIMACGLSLAACSGSLSSWNFLKSTPQTEALRIESEPPGAEAKASGGQTCRTPCELTVAGDSELSVTLALNGYQPQTVSVRPEMPAGNRDGEGLGPKLAPNPVYVELQPTPAAPPAKRHVVKKKKPVAAAQPAPAPTTTASVPTAPPTPPPMPANPPEPAASATNYPWPTR
jgi:PEGA domain